MEWLITVVLLAALGTYTYINFEMLSSYWRALKLMWFQGVIFEDISSVHIDKGVFVGRGTIIHRNVSLHSTSKRATIILDNCEIYPGANIFASIILDRVTIWPNVSMYKAFIDSNVSVHSHNRIVRSDIHECVKIDSYCLIMDSIVSEKAKVGPHAYVHDNSYIGEKAEVAAIEITRSTIGSGTKAKHGRYIGDAKIGKNCNIGAGTVFCNYDGSKKHRTVLEDDVFIGSGTMIIAPRRIGEGASTGAGSVVTKDIPEGETWIGNPARMLPKEK